MTQWADYLISKVNYDSEHLISTAIRHKDTPKGISKGKPIDRLTMASDIKNGLLYITIYSGKDSWKKGSKIQTFSLSGNPYLRIDNNKVSLDFLGDLPEILASNFYSSEELESQLPPITESEEEEATPEQLAQVEQLQKQIQELESQHQSPRGSLPQVSSTELPQELDLAPPPIAESEEEEATPEQLAQVDDLQKQIQELENTLSSQTFPESISDGGEEATPEQLAQVDDLQKQIQELESQHQSPRGSLPQVSSTELPQELDLAPPPIAESEEEEATPEQLAQVDDLQKQIQELENTLSSQTFPESISDGGEEATPEQLAQVDDLQKQIQELENTLSVHLVPSKNSVSDEFSKIHVLETEAKQLESVDNEYEILETLEKQNKKLDDLEKKLSDLTKIDKK